MTECEAVEDRYVLHERIGRGSFGEVWRGQDRQTGEVVAIKVIDLDQAEDEIDDIVQEIKVMALCESAFVTQYYGSHVSGSQLYIIMARPPCATGSVAAIYSSIPRPSPPAPPAPQEYVGGGSILDMMDAFPLTEPYIKTILHDVLRGQPRPPLPPSPRSLLRSLARCLSPQRQPPHAPLDGRRLARAGSTTSTPRARFTATSRRPTC